MTQPADDGGCARSGRRGTALTVLVLVTLLVATSATMYWAWREIGEVEMSGHGLIALGLGVGFSLLVGAGLMALIFFSNRGGYDDRAHEWSKRNSDDRRRR